MKFIGSFPYNAMVLPKRSRKPRREVLFGLMEYEVAEISKGEMEQGVVSVVDTWLYDDPRLVHLRNRQPRETEYSGWKGDLWSQPQQGHPWDAESLREDRQRIHPLLGSEEWPFGRVMDIFHGREWTGITEAHRTRHLEQNFTGEIVSSERARAAAAFQMACNDFVIADSEILTRRREPTLAFGSPANFGIGIMPWAQHPLPKHIFRLDRLAEAEEWHRQKDLRGGLSGQIVRADPAYLKRDDLSHFVANSLSHLIGKGFSPFLPNVTFATLSQWQDLAKIADRAVAVPDQPLPDVRHALTALRALQAELETMSVQADHREARDKLLENVYAPFFRRVDYELMLRPLPELNQEDDAALSAMTP